PADGPTSAGAAADAGSRPKVKKKRGFFRRHLALTSLAVIVVLVVGVAGGYVWWLNHQLSNITRFDAHIKVAPSKKNGDNNQPLNILLLGADNGANGKSVTQDLKDGKWTPGLHRSDTIILAHIPADRSSVQLVSIPRDSWVKVPGDPYAVHGHAKINAAFSWGGPTLAIRVVQDLTHVHIDHVAVIDWSGFKDLTTALGGIPVYIPHTFYDDSQKIWWRKGWQTLEGKPALQYVRTRHGLAAGDLDRIKRQQNFMRAVMGKLLSSGTTRNPITLARVVGVITQYLTVDKTWTNSEIRDLALSMRNLSSADVTFVTAPVANPAGTSSDGQSIVILDRKKLREMIHAVETDELNKYIAANPGSKLPGNTHVR
ncbi:MAG: LCP family protein, partial [Nocardioidaceae bacterium]